MPAKPATKKGKAPGKKPRRNKKTAASIGRRSHTTLNQDFFKLGRQMPGKVKIDLTATKISRIKLENPSGHKSGFFRKIFDSKEAIKASSFGSTYRKNMDKQDELLSTSSVRELMKGVLSERGKLTSDATKYMNKMFNKISRVRLPTKFSGYALENDQMQHPTASGNGYFADSAKTMSRHNELDRQRKERVANAMNEKMNEANSTVEDVINAGLREAISFTLNEFTAPITAKNVKPYALKGKAPESKLNAQVQARENMKSIFVKLGGKQEQSNDTSMDREWRRGRSLDRSSGRSSGEAEVSPPRKINIQRKRSSDEPQGNNPISIPSKYQKQRASVRSSGASKAKISGNPLQPKSKNSPTSSKLPSSSSITHKPPPQKRQKVTAR